jgi:hypothetical protein
LERRPLGYRAARQTGSHRRLEAPGRPSLTFWPAAGDSYAEVVKLTEEGIPFALEHDADLEHHVPAGEHVAA